MRARHQEQEQQQQDSGRATVAGRGGGGGLMPGSAAAMLLAAIGQDSSSRGRKTDTSQIWEGVVGHLQVKVAGKADSLSGQGQGPVQSGSPAVRRLRFSIAGGEGEGEGGADGGEEGPAWPEDEDEGGGAEGHGFCQTVAAGVGKFGTGGGEDMGFLRGQGDIPAGMQVQVPRLSLAAQNSGAGSDGGRTHRYLPASSSWAPERPQAAGWGAVGGQPAGAAGAGADAGLLTSGAIVQKVEQLRGHLSNLNRLLSSISAQSSALSDSLAAQASDPGHAAAAAALGNASAAAAAAAVAARRQTSPASHLPAAAIGKSWQQLEGPMFEHGGGAFGSRVGSVSETLQPSSARAVGGATAGGSPRTGLQPSAASQSGLSTLSVCSPPSREAVSPNAEGSDDVGAVECHPLRSQFVHALEAETAQQDYAAAAAAAAVRAGGGGAAAQQQRQGVALEPRQQWAVEQLLLQREQEKRRQQHGAGGAGDGSAGLGLSHMIQRFLSDEGDGGHTAAASDSSRQQERQGQERAVTAAAAAGAFSAQAGGGGGAARASEEGRSSVAASLSPPLSPSLLSRRGGSQRQLSLDVDVAGLNKQEGQGLGAVQSMGHSISGAEQQQQQQDGGSSRQLRGKSSEGGGSSSRRSSRRRRSGRVDGGAAAIAARSRASAAGQGSSGEGDEADGHGAPAAPMLMIAARATPAQVSQQQQQLPLHLHVASPRTRPFTSSSSSSSSYLDGDASNGSREAGWHSDVESRIYPSPPPSMPVSPAPMEPGRELTYGMGSPGTAGGAPAAASPPPLQQQPARPAGLVFPKGVSPPPATAASASAGGACVATQAAALLLSRGLVGAAAAAPTALPSPGARSGPIWDDSSSSSSDYIEGTDSPVLSDVESRIYPSLPPSMPVSPAPAVPGQELSYGYDDAPAGLLLGGPSKARQGPNGAAAETQPSPAGGSPGFGSPMTSSGGSSSSGGPVAVSGRVPGWHPTGQGQSKTATGAVEESEPEESLGDLREVSLAPGVALLPKALVLRALGPAVLIASGADSGAEDNGPGPGPGLSRFGVQDGPAAAVAPASSPRDGSTSGAAPAGHGGDSARGAEAGGAGGALRPAELVQVLREVQAEQASRAPPPSLRGSDAGNLPSGSSGSAFAAAAADGEGSTAGASCGSSPKSQSIFGLTACDDHAATGGGEDDGVPSFPATLRIGARRSGSGGGLEMPGCGGRGDESDEDPTTPTLVAGQGNGGSRRNSPRIGEGPVGGVTGSEGVSSPSRFSAHRPRPLELTSSSGVASVPQSPLSKVSGPPGQYEGVRTPKSAGGGRLPPSLGPGGWAPSPGAQTPASARGGGPGFSLSQHLGMTVCSLFGEDDEGEDDVAAA